MREQVKVYLLRYLALALCLGFWFACYKMAFGHEKECLYPPNFQVHQICWYHPTFAKEELDDWLVKMKGIKGFRVIDIEYTMLHQILENNECCYTIVFVLDDIVKDYPKGKNKGFKFFPED